jgi:hypothetical protein
MATYTNTTVSQRREPFLSSWREFAPDVTLNEEMIRIANAIRADRLFGVECESSVRKGWRLSCVASEINTDRPQVDSAWKTGWRRTWFV